MNVTSQTPRRIAADSRCQISMQVKRFIVRALAWWTPSTRIQEQVKEHFGIDVRLERISYYNPDLPSLTDLSQELRAYFLEEREKAQRELDDIPIAHLPYRLRQSQERMERLDARLMGDLTLAIDEICRTLGVSRATLYRYVSPFGQVRRV